MVGCCPVLADEGALSGWWRALQADPRHQLSAAFTELILAI